MARTNSLTNFLTDVANAIRTKTGSSAAIDADDFDTEIENIPSGHDWSAIGISGEPTSIEDDYQYSVDKKTNWDPTTTTMPSVKFKDANLVYMPDLDMRRITTNDAFEGTFNLTSNNRLKAVGKIKANPYGSIKNMFKDCGVLTQADLSELDTTHVTNMNNMFANCFKLAPLDLNNFVTNSVTDMNSMFFNCHELASLDLSNFVTNSVTNMRAMFSNCNKLASLDLSNFVTNSVTDMDSMFSGCSKLASLNISNFNTGSTTVMSSMFYGCKELSSLDLSHFTTSGVTTMRGMFNGCSNLVTVSVNNWETSTVTTAANMFRDCTSLTAFNRNYGNYKFTVATNLSGMFRNCSSLTSLDLSTLEPTTANKNLANMFDGCTSLMHLDIRSLTFSGITTATYYTDIFGASASSGVPDNCEIIVKDATEKSWINTKFSRLTNVKTAAEYEAEQNA